MDAHGLPIVGPGIDYTKVEAVHQKRTLAFLNHFISHTARFLNRFSCVCEEKLEVLSNRIQKLEVTMSILETKLSSIPGLENVKASQSTGDTTVTTTPSVTTSQPQTTTQQPVEQQPAPAAVEVEVKSEPEVTVSQLPQYAQYFKMMRLGVNEMAVKNKMRMEGFDPNILDNPDAPASAYSANIPPQNKDSSDSDNSSVELDD